MVLDLFLLEGMHQNKVIFDITLGYLKCIEEQVLACKDEEDFQKALNCVVDSKTLMGNIRAARADLKQTIINFFRPVADKEVLDDSKASFLKKS